MVARLSRWPGSAGYQQLLASDQVRLPLALLGIGIGLATPAAQNASLSAVARKRSGMVAGVSSMMRYLGGIIGIADGTSDSG